MKLSRSADTSNGDWDSITIPEEFGFYGNSIVEDSSGSLIEVTPTPGWGPNDPDSSVALNIVNCYKVADTSSADAFILKGPSRYYGRRKQCHQPRQCFGSRRHD